MERAISVNNAKELGKALDDEAIEIIITDPKTGKDVIRIKATKKAAMVVAVGCVVVAVVALLSSPAAAAAGPAGIAVEGFIAAPVLGGAISVWGVATTIAAVSIGIGSRSGKILYKLYNDYDIVKNGHNRVVLRRKG